MHVVVEYSRPVRGDDRFHCPGAPPKDKVPPEGYTYPPVPDILYPVMLHTEDGSLQRVAVRLTWSACSSCWRTP